MIPAPLIAPHKRTAAALTGTCGLIMVGLLITGCSTAGPGQAAAQSSAGSAGSAASPAASRPASATPSTGTPAGSTPAGAPGCLASGLQAQLGAAQGTAGTIYQVIVLTNTSASSCTLQGYPGVSFVTGPGGHEIGAPAARNPAVAVTLLTLPAGGKANVLLAVHDAGAFGGCRLTSADWLRIYPPGDYGSLYVQYKAQTCANRAKSITTVTAVAAGAGSAS